LNDAQKVLNQRLERKTAARFACKLINETICIGGVGYVGFASGIDTGVIGCIDVGGGVSCITVCAVCCGVCYVACVAESACVVLLQEKTCLADTTKQS
jgi:hypothetical protein